MTKDQIIEAMVEQIDTHMLGDTCGDDGVGYVGCDCGLWFGKAAEGGWDRAKAHTAEAALDAAFPLIQEALAEQVRFTDADWREYQAIPDQGYSHRHWLDHRAARLIEGATL